MSRADRTSKLLSSTFRPLSCQNFLSTGQKQNFHSHSPQSSGCQAQSDAHLWICPTSHPLQLHLKYLGHPWCQPRHLLQSGILKPIKHPFVPRELHQDGGDLLLQCPPDQSDLLVHGFILLASTKPIKELHIHYQQSVKTFSAWIATHRWYTGLVQSTSTTSVPMPVLLSQSRSG